MNTTYKAAPADVYVPMRAWGTDHWSTLAYIETVMVECAGFEIGLDCRMRSDRRNFRVMSQQCPHPKRAGNHSVSLRAVVMSPEHTSRLKTGTTENHDDWCCVQDMAAEGLFSVGPDAIEPGVTLHLSPKGSRIVSALRVHKAKGGKFADFEPRG